MSYYINNNYFKKYNKNKASIIELKLKCKKYFMYYILLKNYFFFCFDVGAHCRFL